MAKKLKSDVMMKISAIKENIKNPRKGDYDIEELEELQASMDSLGQLTSIKIDEDSVLLAGHRRLAAAKNLGWTTIRVDVISGLTVFEKSTILIGDNATQKQFRPWDYRQAITDIYWNEFCEEYEFKTATDKGYKEFARRVGLSYTMIRKMVESMSKDNLKITTQLKGCGYGTDVVDLVVAAPKNVREKLTQKAIELAVEQKEEKTEDDESVRAMLDTREQLRMLKKRLIVEENKGTEELHPNFFSAVYAKLSAISLGLTYNILKQAAMSDRIKLKAEIEKHIIPIYRQVSELCKVED